MKKLKEIVSKNLDSDVKTELLCNAIEEWIVNELAPEIQGWIIKEFSPQIEKWVKDYVMDNHTALHIEDFCVDDSVDDEESDKNEKD